MPAVMCTVEHKSRATVVDVVIGYNLRNCRCARGLSQQALASGVGLTYQQLQKYEYGKSRISASRLYEISRLLNVPYESFFIGLETR